MKDLVTPKQVALALGVSEASLKRWCDKGLLPAARTAGGHRRLPISGVLQFIRRQGNTLVRPEVLGLPAATGRTEASLDRARETLREALEQGDEAQVSRFVLNLYLSGHPAHEICDKVIAGAFHDIGERWSHGDTEVYQERRAVELATRALLLLRAALPEVPPAGPVAIGGTLSGDPYTLQTLMVELSLREAGWRAQSLGIGLPAETLCAAIMQLRPRLFWLCVSAMENMEHGLAQADRLYQTTVETGSAMVVGGRALSAAVRERMQYSAYADHLGHLVAFARTIAPPRPAEPGPHPPV